MLFLKKYPHIYKIKSKKGKVIPFKHNKIQKLLEAVIDQDIKEKGYSRRIYVKGRQGGVTTYFQLKSLSYAMSEKAINCYTMAHDSQTAKDIFDDKIKFAFDNLPEKLKGLYKTKRDNVRQIMFDDEMKQAKVTVGTGARGTTQNILHISEAGKMSEKKKVWDEMVSGTLQASKQAKIIAIESTADGGLGPFYEMVQKALKGENGFDVTFISWTLTDEYQATPPEDNNWKNKYNDLAKIHKLYSDPVGQFGLSEAQFYWYYLTAQELGGEVKVQYPLTLDEAFIAKSSNLFDLNLVKNTETKPAIRNFQGVKIFREPENRVYSMGIDASRGRQNGDFTSIKVRAIEGNKYLDIASYKGKANEELTFTLAKALAEYYNQLGKCYVAPEVNNMGIYIVNKFKESDYPKHLQHKRESKDASKQLDQTRLPDFGYETTSKTRPIQINEMAKLFHAGEVEILDYEEKQEMINFIWNEKNNRYEARDGQHDDLIMADSICIQNFKYIAKHGGF